MIEDYKTYTHKECQDKIESYMLKKEKKINNNDSNYSKFDEDDD